MTLQQAREDMLKAEESKGLPSYRYLHSVPDNTPLSDPIRIFVYGTLKRNHANHGFCAGYKTVQKAKIRGVLFDSGIPRIRVPDEDIHAYGTYDYVEDIRTQNNTFIRETMPLHGWRTVHGELYEFDVLSTINYIDRLEGYVPNNRFSSYKRVLVPVYTLDNDVMLSWVYMSNNARIVNFDRIVPDGIWRGLPRRYHRAKRSN